MLAVYIEPNCSVKKSMGRVQALTQVVVGRGLRRVDVRVLVLVMREISVMLRAWIWAHRRPLHLVIPVHLLQLPGGDLNGLRRWNCRFEVLVFQLVLVALVRPLVASSPLAD